MKVIEANHLKKEYSTTCNTVKALDDVSITIQEGEFLAIVGSTESGKTTLLNILGGLDIPTSGEVRVRGKEINKMNEEELTIFRRRNIGFVFQNYNLVPILNVLENVVLPLNLDGRPVDKKFIDKIIESLGLQSRLDHMPNMLSGGQQQRVAIARALSTKPAVILADEPTGNLDSKTGIEVIGLLKASASLFHQTIVIITHNEEIAQMADRIICIEDGRITGDQHEKQ